MLTKIKGAIKSVTNIHRPDGSPNVFLFSTPRSGSTWLTELIQSQPGFKYCDEPLDLRKPLVRQHLGLTDWKDFFNPDKIGIIQNYFQAFCDGRLHFMDPHPLRGYYRPITHRIVFKMIHGIEDRINWFADKFNGRILYLIRHPIAVSLSREVYPRLPAFLNSEFRQYLTRAQFEYAQKICASGTKLEQGVLTWCLENMLPLRDVTVDWAIVSYEQTVLEPGPIIEYLVDKLALSDPERMLKRLTVPSAVKAKSDQETQRILEERAAAQRPQLVAKWRKRVNEAEERRVMEIVERFELDVYKFGEVMPAERLWIASKAIPNSHQV